MIGWLAVVAWAEPAVTLDRVDLLAEAPALWISQELPRMGTTPAAWTRLATQVQPVLSTPWPSWQLGLSLQAQSVLVEHTAAPHAGLGVHGGLITRAGLPVGGLAGASWRPGRVRLGLSTVVLSGASWARPSYRSWRVLPGVGLGVGRDLRPQAPWMDEG